MTGITNLDKEKKSKTNSNTETELIPIVLDSISDIKGKNVVKLDLRKLDDRPTDFFIICEGDSSTQVNAIAENVKRRVKQDIGILPLRSEGMMGAKWVLVDYFDVVVHVFYRETREYYELEDLWSDAVFTEYEDSI